VQVVLNPEAKVATQAKNDTDAKPNKS
jgi:hypothetical protein